MSTLAYAALTTVRDDAKPGTSTTTNSPGVKTYVDAMAALVPAEVLTLHAVMLSYATKVQDPKTTILLPDAVGPFFKAFIGLIILSIALYVIPRIKAKKWDNLDWARSAIPPLAFITWTMLQRTTAFDAALAYLELSMKDISRTFVGIFIAVGLGLAATYLAYQADQKDQSGGNDHGG